MSNGATLRASIEAERSIRLQTDSNVPITIELVAPENALPAWLEADRDQDRSVLVTTLGRAAISRAPSLFMPAEDEAMTVRGANAHWIFDLHWKLHAVVAKDNPLSVRIQSHYYRDTLGIKWYAPITKREPWGASAPIVAMTWYGIKGWEGHPAQRKDWIFPQVDWVAEHLLPYAETLTFQLDDNYLYSDDAYMRALSDYIRAKGLRPGLWLTPYGIAPATEEKAHPEWFLHGKDGAPLTAFAGVNWREPGRNDSDNVLLNVTNQGAVDAWFGMFWKKVSDTWNFDFFKIDGQPTVAERYRQSVDGNGEEGYRRGLEIARNIIGPDKFINGCYGIPLEGIGLMDGSRTGGDSGGQPHAIDVITEYNFLNNIAWWCDPDAAADLYAAPVETVRLNAQARALTGQQFLTDDTWTKVPPENYRVWQQSFPMLDIHPANLYRIRGDWTKYDLFDLRIGREWGTWDVVGLNNYYPKVTETTLDLARLPLDAARVHVYEYWSGAYLGEFGATEKIARTMKGHEGQLFSVTPVLPDRPALVSTSRHVSQGGLDLEKLRWSQSADAWEAQGKSSHLVSGDSYDLVFAVGRFGDVSAECDAGAPEIVSDGRVVRVRITPASREVTWKVDFKPPTKPMLSVSSVPIEFAAPDRKAEISVFSMGAQSVAWKASASDPRIRLGGESGDLAPWPASQTVPISIDAAGLLPGSTWNGVVTFTAADTTHRVPVSLHMPPPPNLALEAAASASSSWGDEYRSVMVKDGTRLTRWNSAHYDLNGAWVQLAWAKPVPCNRIVIDECKEYGNRVQAWRLEADGQVIAKGGTLGPNYTIKLPQPVTVETLKLIVENATVEPTITEIEVYDWPE
jgi:hypothetical protein